MQTYNSRKEVPEKYKWNLKSIFESEEAYEECYSKCQDNIKTLKTYKGKMQDANKLYEFLQKYFDVLVTLYRVYIYAYILNDQELGNSKNIERKDKAENLLNEYLINSSFFEPELLKISKSSYEKLFKDNEHLLEYRVSLDDIYRNKKHILPEDKEIIVTKLSNAMNHFDDMSSMMLNSLHNYGYVKIDGKKEKIMPTNYRRFMRNKDSKVRNIVRNSYYKKIKEYAPLSASFLNGFVNASIENAKIHYFDTPFEAKLFRRKMSRKAYDALISASEENTKVVKKFFNFYKKTLNLKKLTFADLSLDMVQNNKEYSIEEAEELCLNAIKPLGEDYYQHFKKIFDERYIDYTSYPGKCSGGYCISGFDDVVRILMSFNYNLSSVSTIIHEGGHCVHHKYLYENNPIWYREKPTIISEVASLTNECLLSGYLMENGKNKDERLSGIDNIMKVFINNFFSAVREAKMEIDFYEYAQNGNTITEEYLNKITTESLEKYYKGAIKIDDYASLTWVPRSHYYMNFYLCDYAFCISVASNIASRILAGDKDMLQKYLEFLKTGSDKTVEETFGVLGFNINDKKIYEDAIKYFDSLINKYEEINEEGEVNGK